MQKNIYKSKLFLQRSSPTILTCIAAIGVGLTAVATARATIKVTELLKEEEEKKGIELTKMEIVQTAVPVYIPAIAIGLSTISCIFGANTMNKQKQASIASAYALLNSYHKEYRKKLIELHGEETDIEVRNAIAREYCNYHCIDINEPDRKVLFYDEISKRSVLRYEREIIDAEYHFNRNFCMRGYAYLNEFYEYLGLPHTKYGKNAGWSMASGIEWVDFEHRMIASEEGVPMYLIDMVFFPDILNEWEC